jgi:hypothetical protein
VWEEMLLEWNLTLGPDVIVQSWRSDEAVKRIVESGHKALVGNYQYWVRIYLPPTPFDFRLRWYELRADRHDGSILTAAKANGLTSHTPHPLISGHTMTTAHHTTTGV